jgi:anti-sigma regulatory factor (Ser/Thr protein kinase)
MPHASRLLPPDATSVKLARGFVSDMLGEVLTSERLEHALLLTSELATNAVVHAGSPFEVIVLVDDATARVGVQDEGDGRPMPRTPGPDAVSGRGLVLVGRLADRWGVDPVGSSKCVWFELDR